MAAESDILAILTQVYDPEIPVLNIVEMGIVRSAKVMGGKVVVKITPTYSGCPAMHLIEDEILIALRNKGYSNVDVQTTFSPPWTTDWLSDETKNKLKQYGIAPPGKADDQLITIGSTRKGAVPCPFCNSSKTHITSEFGSTACKALHYCNSCQQPFEEFKAI